MAVEFDEPKVSGRYKDTPPGAPKTKMTAALINWGIVGTPAQANILLLVLSIILIALAFIIYQRDIKETEIKLDPSIDPETYLPYGIEPPR